MRYIDKH